LGFFRDDLGVSLNHYGYYQGAWAFVYAVGSILAGLMVNKFDHKKMLYYSALICIFGLIVIILLTVLDIKNPLLISLGFLPISIGAIVPSTIIYPLCINYMPQAKGRVSGLCQGIRLIFTAIGLEITGYFYVGSFQNIGIIISIFVLASIITLFWTIKTPEFINHLKQE
jgi:DHA1 family bicyclomycin/chloramphenicol resistance-like MFS transporter